MVCKDETSVETPEGVLVQSEQRFKDLVENTTDWVWEVDEAIRYVYVSPKVFDLIGYRPEEVLGKTPFDFMPPDEAARIRAGVELLITDPRPFQRLENINIHKDGSLRVLETSGIPIFDRDGRFAGLRGIDRDVTARKEAELKIRQLNEALAERAVELEAANKELETFNYTVAHDLRQPLNLLNVYCQTMEQMFGEQLPEECLRYLHEQSQVISKMDRLIEALLKFSRLAHVELHRQQVDLSMLAREVCQGLTRANPQRQAEFIIAPGLVTDCDSNLVQIVFNNLIGNAWKYSSNREKAVIEFGAKDIEGARTFYIRDNGVGFDMADAAKLFTPFQRLPDAEQFRGFGIGLATVERVIQRHGGKVWAEGERDKGTCVYFTLG